MQKCPKEKTKWNEKCRPKIALLTNNFWSIKNPNRTEEGRINGDQEGRAKIFHCTHQQRKHHEGVVAQAIGSLNVHAMKSAAAHPNLCDVITLLEDRKQQVRATIFATFYLLITLPSQNIFQILCTFQLKFLTICFFAFFFVSVYSECKRNYNISNDSGK